MSIKGKKSDDSVLADAQAAREAERLGRVAPEDQFEHTFEEVKDAPQRARAEGADDARVKELENQVAELRKMMSETLKQRPISTAALSELRQRELKRSEIPVCQHCGQFTTVCSTPDARGNHHVTLRVLPDRPEHMAGFPGVIWNNVVYLGMCIVPAVCAPDILAAVRNWSEYQFALQHNRGRIIGKNPGEVVTERNVFPIYGTRNGA